MKFEILWQKCAFYKKSCSFSKCVILQQFLILFWSESCDWVVIKLNSQFSDIIFIFCQKVAILWNLIFYYKKLQCEVTIVWNLCFYGKILQYPRKDLVLQQKVVILKICNFWIKCCYLTKKKLWILKNTWGVSLWLYGCRNKWLQYCRNIILYYIISLCISD